MKTIAHTYETERICKFQVGIMENNGKLKQIEGLEPKEYKEEIIRCQDCLYWEDEDYCLHWQTSRYEAPCTLPEDFCSYAEKKVD